MASNFPATGIDTFTNPTPTNPRNSPSASTAVTNLNSAVTNIETKIGLGTSSPSSGTVLRGNGAGTSVWGDANLTTDVTGVLPVANGGTNASTTSAARTSLGVAIGSDVQAYNANLTTWQGKTAPSGTVVGDGDTQTLTNKTLTTPVIATFYQDAGKTKLLTAPAVTDTIAVIGTAQTWTDTQTEKSILWSNNAITATANAATVPITYRLNTVTNNSAATLTITMTTTSATDGQLTEVRILDFSAAAQTITWVNTENSQSIAPVTSNGSTTLPLSVLFQYNGNTSKWRCIAVS